MAPDRTRQNDSNPQQLDENQHSPYNTIDRLYLESTQEEPPDADMLTNREAYLESRPDYLGYAIAQSARPCSSTSHSSNDDQGHENNDEMAAQVLKAKSKRIMDDPARPRSAPPDPDANMARRPDDHPLVVPPLLHSQSPGSAPSSPSLASELNPRTPSSMDQSVYASEEQSEESDAGSMRASDFPIPPSSSGEEEQPEVETREVEEERHPGQEG